MTTDPPGRRPTFRAGDLPLDGALAFLDLAYDAAETPSRLPEALLLLGELVGAASVLLLSNEGGERRLVAAAHATSRPANDSGAVQLRSDRVRTIPLSGGLELVVDPGAIEPLQEVLLLRLAPHLARALRLSVRHAHEEESGHLLAARIDRLPLAVALLDSSGQIAFLNRAARSVLSDATSVAIDAHRLVPGPAVSRALYEALVERVTGPADPERRFVGGRLSITDGQWGRIDLLVAPFAARLAQGETSAVVLLSARGVSPLPEERLRDICGLSEEESRAAIDVVAGRGRDEDANPEVTAEILRAIYRKLGTTRQTDLLRLLLRPPGVVFESAATRSRTL